MKTCTQQEFEQHLKALQDDKESGLTGPFIHSAPNGNMHREPFSEHAWMIGMETVLRKVWTLEEGWIYFVRYDESAGLNQQPFGE